MFMFCEYLILTNSCTGNTDNMHVMHTSHTLQHVLKAHPQI